MDIQFCFGKGLHKSYCLKVINICPDGPVQRALLAVFVLLITVGCNFYLQEAVAKGTDDWSPDLIEVSEVDPVIRTVLDLIVVPSPSGNEAELAASILDRVNRLGIKAQRDTVGNIFGSIAASRGYENAPGLIFAAHMDVVALDQRNANRPVKPKLLTSEDKEWIASDETTTLGADNKAGIATILDTLTKILGRDPHQHNTINHGPLEFVFTVEEETTSRGVLEFDTTKLQSQYMLVVDGFKIYELVVGVAGTTEIRLRIHGLRGGHSGDEIDRPDNVNAIKVMSELDSLIPQGVIKRKNGEIVTSINAGLAQGGMALNVIAPEATLEYLVRSSDQQEEETLIEGIQNAVKAIEKKYKNMQPNFRIESQVSKTLPPWSTDSQSPLVKLVQRAAKKTSGEIIRPRKIHAGSDVSIYGTRKKNSMGFPLEPLLLGVASIERAHSVHERMDWRSLIAGRDWLLEIIRLTADQHR